MSLAVLIVLLMLLNFSLRWCFPFSSWKLVTSVMHLAAALLLQVAGDFQFPCSSW